MTPELTPDLRQAVHQASGNQPLRLIDPETNTVYVLVPAEQYDRSQAELHAAQDALSDTYAAQTEAALRAGWGQPEMSQYDHYDENQKSWDIILGGRPRTTVENQ